MVYYRYLYFGEYGRVLYALTCTPPHEMFPRLARVCLLKNNTCSSSTNATIGSSSSIRGSGSTNAHTNSHKDAAAVWGQYTVHKTTVTVTAQQEWQHVQLTLTIDLDNRSHGRYGCLLFDHHVSSASGNFNNTTDTTTTNTGWGTPLSDCVVYDVPGEPFRFVKDKRL